MLLYTSRNPEHRGHVTELAKLYGLFRDWQYLYRDGKTILNFQTMISPI